MDRSPAIPVAADHLDECMVFVGNAGGIDTSFKSFPTRQDIERMTEAKVYLKLLVRVEKNWRKDSKAIERFCY
jgi:GTPase Era involved in 16S rRNA processing